MRAFNIKREDRGMRVGLFGGTFNPIHLGHLRGAEEIRETFDLGKVIFIPAAIPPHKGMGGMMDASHRLEMVRLAVSTNPYFSVSDIELERSGKSYSIDTIRHFREIHQGPLFFILGRDAFLEIETWKEFKTLFSLCHFIVMARPGSQEKGHGSALPGGLTPYFKYHPAAEAWVHASGNNLSLKEITFLDISSTKVRLLMERGESIRYLIPTEVEAYIREKGLYQGDRQMK
jgi:nicotinate-nucleotide adenylyltransferase